MRLSYYYSGFQASYYSQIPPQYLRHYNYPHIILSLLIYLFWSLCAIIHHYLNDNFLIHFCYYFCHFESKRGHPPWSVLETGLKPVLFFTKRIYNFVISTSFSLLLTGLKTLFNLNILSPPPCLGGCLFYTFIESLCFV